MVFKSLFGSKKSDKAEKSSPPAVVTTPQYQAWREAMFKITPEQAGASDNEGDQVYGVLMDIGMVDQQSRKPFALSLTAFASGEASFQPTPGGGVLGLGNDEKIGQAARALVGIGDINIMRAQPTDNFDLPEPGFVQFFFLTSNGVRVYAEHLNTMQRPDNPFFQMLGGFGFIRQFAEGVIDKQQAKR